MAEFQKAAAAVENYFKTQWAIVQPTIPVQYDNVPWREPNGTPFVGFAMREGSGFQSALGQSQHRFAGILDVRVFVPEDSGPKTARDLADAVATIFRRKTVIVTGAANSDVVRCYTPSKLEQGLDGGWWKINVTVPFVRDVRL